ncbi:MAG: putative baseplate assembly protein [Deltaproteobacteria bacterium]|nr:MAG: putative baseplate assembly protein [Deltaproteobacteria bacterium]
MSLPVPNLDDRSWKQIVDEAVRLIPRYCPEWTNHNASDPGITLLELYAWMTEMVIYRLNKVPEKNFLTFLDLIGVRLKPPEPARAVLELTPAEGTEGELVVKKGTQVATLQAGGGDPVTFETLRDIALLPVHVVRAASSHRANVADHSEALASRDAREALFAGVQEVERFLYLGDDRLNAFNEEAAVDLFFEAMPGSSGPRVPTITEWQYFDGKRWRDMTVNRAESDTRRLSFGSHPGIEKQLVNGQETFWIRGKLAEPLKDPASVQLDSVSLRVEILGEGMAPENAFVNIGNYIFLPVDQGKSFHPFGEEPKFDCAAYLGHKQLFAAPEARIRIEAQLVEPSVVPSPEGSPDLVVAFEYWNGRKWAELGKSSPMGVSGAQGQYNFLDSTGAFTRNGAISFDRPADLIETEVGGVKNFWIRARINSGNYGAPGSYELQGANWVFKEDRPLQPPCLKSLVFKYVREPKPVAHCLSYNDFQYRDHTDDLNTPYVYFQPFLPDQDESPAFYLGFDAKFPQRTCSVYFELDDSAVGGGEQLGGPPPGAAEEDAAQKGPRVVWEFWEGGRWADLLPQDQTFGFTRSGYLTFSGPRNLEKRNVFDTEAFWLRARLESGSYDLPPVLRAVLVNAVDALNGVTLEEVVGSSDGSIDQSFELANKPILAAPSVWVLEPDAPAPADRKIIEEEEGPESIKPDPDGAGTWVRWHEVENFFDSQPGSRHYLCDPIKGEITFGDGRKGWVPPSGRDSVKCEYRVGGGVAGNVGGNTLTVLKQSIAFVQAVTNPFSAQGGADAETIDEAKRRGTYAIKNRDRAITAEDYESLALAASRRVARAKCVQGSDGSISLLLVPKAEREDGDARAVPSRDLIDRVASYIDKRRLITARVNVGKPRLVPLSLELTISLKPGATADRVKADVKEKVKRLLNPLHGGPKGDGWPFGRAVGKADLYPVVEGVDGVDRITDLVIIDEGRRLRVEMLKLSEDELPNLIGVEIYDRG